MTRQELIFLLNAVNLYLALHYNDTPMPFTQLVAALNPQHRRPLRFYFLSLWAYFSVAAALVCVLLPVCARITGLLHAKLADQLSIALAILIEMIWAGYALTVFSWRLSGYLYSNAAAATSWIIARIQLIVKAHLPNLFHREEV